ncbi:MAG: FkbM family methyltransferase [Vicinamibacterales bacterium]
MFNNLLLRYIRSPEHPGKYRVVQWLGRHAIPSEGLVAEVNPRVRLSLHPRDWIEYSLIRAGHYEPLTLAFLTRNLRTSDRALLAGVNNGLHVIVAARAVGDNGRVVGVDPQPAALLRARRNIDLNGVAGPVRLLAAALGSEPALAHMPWADAANQGAASLLDSGPGLEVPLVTLAAVLDAFCPEGVRLMLLDVQGYEGIALQGLKHHRPQLLVIEDSVEYLERVGSSRAKLYSQVRDMGYALHDVFGSSIDESGAAPAEYNIIAVRRGADANWCPSANAVASAQPVMAH